MSDPSGQFDTKDLDLKNSPFRLAWYALVGFGIGGLFPFLASVIVCRSSCGSFSLENFITIQKTNSLLWIIDGVPVMFALSGIFLWIKQNQINGLIHFLTYRLESKSTELSEAKNRLENILYSMADLIIVMDEKGIIREVNDSTLLQFGFEKNELIGQSGKLILGDHYSKIVISETEDLFECGFINEVEGVYPTRHGNNLVLNSSVSRIFDEAGKITTTICVAQDISDRKDQEIKIEKAKEQFESLFNNAPLTIVIVQHDHIVFFNPTALHHLGYDADEFTGFPTEKIVHPDDAESLLTQLKENDFSHNSDLSTLSFRVITKSKEIRWVDLKTTPFVWENEPAFLNFIIDTTERHQIEQALFDSEKKFRDLVQSLNVIIMKLDANDHFTFMNRFGVEFFGHPEKDLLGKSMVETIVPRFDSEGKNLHQRHLDFFKKPTDIIVFENENIKRNGERVWVSWSKRPVFDEKGSLIEIMSIGTDITDRKKADDLIKSQNKMLRENQQRVLDELEQARNAQSTLITASTPTMPGIKLATRYDPMTQIGGDFYDLFENGEDSLGILVGDVTGHGIPAALLSFLFLTTFKNHRSYGSNPDFTVTLANQFLAGKLPAGKYATVFLCDYDVKTRILRYTSAGHPAAFLLRQNSTKVTHLETRGMVVGFFKHPVVPFETNEIELAPGDKVIIYTDGILEVFDENDQIQTSEALEEFILKNQDNHIQVLIDQIYEFSLRQTDNRGFTDDITMIGLEIDS